MVHARSLTSLLVLLLAVGCQSGSLEIGDGAPRSSTDAPPQEPPAEAGQTLSYEDGDGDGYGDPATAMLVDGDAPLPGQVAIGGDCDDTDPAVHPGAEETCDGVDEDCDSLIDDQRWYRDGDGDGWGSDDDVVVVDLCQEPPGRILTDGDCDDHDAEVHPEAIEVCGDAIDNDCDDNPSSCGGPGTHPVEAADASAKGEGGLRALGAALVGLGDFNGDGIDDFAAGAPDTDAQVGAVAIYLGPLPPDDLLQASVTIHGANTRDLFGSSLAALGDVNGDGRADLAIGAPGVSVPESDAGAVYTVWGCDAAGSFSVLGLPGASIHGEAAYDELGTSLAAGHDLDGDGVLDLAMGAPGASAGGVRGGAAYLVPGDASGVIYLSDPGASTAVALGVLDGEEAGTALGIAHERLAIGAPGAGSGRVYVWETPDPGLTLLPDVGWVARGGIGARLTMADVLGTWRGELVVADPMGDVRAYAGPWSGQRDWSDHDLRLHSANIDVVANAREFDGAEETAELLLVSSSESTAYVQFNGGPSGDLTDARWIRRGGEITTAAGAGDLNGDGYADVVLGAPDSGASGALYVFLGGPGY